VVGRHSFFFFQAEDGIRDFHVTGVQTCALPIFGLAMLVAGWIDGADWSWLPGWIRGNVRLLPLLAALIFFPLAVVEALWRYAVQIGRASCRERESTEAVAGVLRRQRGRGTLKSE